LRNPLPPKLKIVQHDRIVNGHFWDDCLVNRRRVLEREYSAADKSFCLFTLLSAVSAPLACYKPAAAGSGFIFP
jgi:hypothetical protein